MDRIEGAPKVRNITLSDEEREKLVNYIHEEVEQALQDRGRLEKKWEVWAKQVKSRLLREDIGQKDAKIDVGLTGERINAVKSRLINAIFQQDRIFYTHPTEPRFTEAAREYDDLIDYEWSRFDAQGLLDSWLDNGLALSAGFVKVPYTEEVEYVKKFREIDITAPEELGTADATTVKDNKFVEETREAKRRVGAFPRTVDTTNMLFPIASPSLERAEWVAERLWMTKRDLDARVKSGLFDKKAVESIGKPQGKPELLMACEVEKHPSVSKQYEVLEFYTCREVKKGEGQCEIIIWIERHSKQVLRICYNFYEFAPRPYVDWCYRATNGSVYGTPATFILEPLHRAYSASFSQELDAASKANEMCVFGPVGSDLSKHFEKGLVGGFYETQAAMDQFKEFKLGQPMTLNPQLRQQLSMHADKLMGLSPGSFGLEQAQRPTATGQVEHLEEGRQPLHSTLESFRYSLTRVCEMMLARLRQFKPESIQLYLRKETTDPNTPEESLWKMFEWPEEMFTESVNIRVKASSAKMNKNLRKQEAVAMLDRIPQVYSAMMQMLQQVNPQNPTAPVALQLLQGFQETFNEFLIEFDVPKKDMLNPDIQEAMNYGQMVAQQMGQMQSQIQQMGQQNQQLQFQLAQLSGQAPQGMAPGVPPHGVPQAPNPGAAPPQG